MNPYLSIDPGNDTGWALWDPASKLMVDCGIGAPLHFDKPSLVVIEKPQVYPNRVQKKRVDPNDLITLAIGVGRYAQRFESEGATVTLVLPRIWKGQLPKEVHHRRIKKDLSPIESSRYDFAAKRYCATVLHNMLDAIGLGQWAFSEGPWR